MGRQREWLDPHRCLCSDLAVSLLSLLNLRNKLRGRSPLYKRIEKAVQQANALSTHAASPKARAKILATALLYAVLQRQVRVELPLKQGPFTVSDFSGMLVLSEVFDGHAYPRNALPDSAALIVDGGAHIGVSIRYLHDLYPGARIVGFEPDPYTWQTALFNVLRRPMIQVRQAALAGAAVSLTLTRSSGGSWATSAYAAGSGDTFVVEAVPLDDVVSEFGRIDLLKLDIEGGEWDVLRQSKHLDQVGCIVGELHAAAGISAEKFLGFLEQRGFRIVHDDIERTEPKGTFVASR
jgi:FkbM family methyltransferase